MAKQSNGNSMQHLLDRIETMYENMLKYSEVCATAVYSTEDIVKTTITTDTGETKELSFPSFNYIQNQIAAFEQNLSSLTGTSNGKQVWVRLVQKNDEIKTLIYQSLVNVPADIPSLVGTIDDYNNVAELGNVLLDKTTALGMCMQVNVTGIVSSQMKSAQITKYVLTDDAYAKVQTFFAGLNKTEMSHAEMLAAIVSLPLIAGDDYELEDYTQELRARRAMSSGKFVALQSKLTSGTTLSIRFDTLSYNSVDAAVKGSKTLVIGDTLATAAGDLLLKITAIDALSNTVQLTRSGGTRSIADAFKNEFVYVDPIVQKVVDVPIRHSEKFVCFISAVHEAYHTIGDYSPAMFVNVTNLTIRDADGNLQNANAYMLAKGDANIGSYITSIVTDMYPPAKYAITPAKPAFNATHVKVVQINTHLIDSTDRASLTKLYEQKRSLQQEISRLDSSISSLSLQLNTRNYTSESEKASISEQYIRDNRSRNEKLETLRGIVDSMLDVNSASYDALYSPKFRIRGFVPVADPIVSRFTSPQHTIQFKVQYRYVSLSNVVQKADTFDIQKTTTAGDTVTETAAYSTWNEYFTPLRRKAHTNNNDAIEWEPINESSIDAICCNQLDIPISSNEIVQIRVKAINEPGYPNILTESEWSSIVTMQFPAALAENSKFATLKDELRLDKQQLELENMLANKGLLKHIEASTTDVNGTYFAHALTQIDSGFLTAELGKITAYEKLLELSNSITRLNDIVVNSGSMLRLSILDETGVETEVVNSQIISLYAGAYINEIDINDPSNYGKVFTKTYWLKYTNISDAPLNIYSMFPGEAHKTIKQINAPKNFNAPWSPMTFDVAVGSLQPAPYGSTQFENQIAYLGNKRVNGVDNLYISRTTIVAPTIIDPVDIDTAAAAETRIYVQPIDSADLSRGFKTVALKATADADKYTLIHKNAPAYAAYVADAAQIAGVISMFNNVSAYDGTEKTKLQVGVYSEVDNPKVMFADYDEYTCGTATRGATLVMSPNVSSAMQINGSTNEAALAVRPGANNALLIPIVFQARMTDAVGKIDGTTSIGTAQFRYEKTINIHTFIAGKELSFDVKVYCDFRPTTALRGASN